MLQTKKTTTGMRISQNFVLMCRYGFYVEKKRTMESKRTFFNLLSQRADLFIIGYAIFSSVLFIVGSGISMLLYKGGNRLEQDTGHYSFLLNYFSDLGRIYTYTGNLNLPVSIIYGVTFFQVALVWTAFNVVWPKTLKGEGAKLAKIGAFVSMFSSLAFVAVIFTPMDMVPKMHDYSVFLAFVLNTIAMFIYAYCVYKNSEYSRKYAVIYTSFLAVQILYIFLMIYGTMLLDDQKGLLLKVSSQKIVVYSLILSQVIQGLMTFQKISQRQY